MLPHAVCKTVIMQIMCNMTILSAQAEAINNSNITKVAA
jgi:hypothetical protein